MEKYLFAFLKCKGVGNVKLLNYLKRYNFDIELVLKHKSEIINEEDMNSFKQYVLISKKEIENNRQNGINIISVFDKKYPVKLISIKDPILYLYYKGNIGLVYNTSIAVIGSRKITSKDEQLITRLAKYISCKNITVVSGLALGSDTCAHLGSYNNSGHTIAVMPSGIDVITPISNKKLANEIINNNGLIVSEYSIGTVPTKYTYVKRDRIQAALSDALVIVKASEISGTMHAIKIAKESNKYVAQYRDNYNKLINNTFNDKEDINKIIEIAKNMKYEIVENIVHEQESLF